MAHECNDCLLVKKCEHDAYAITPVYTQLYMDDRLQVEFEDYNINTYLSRVASLSINKNANHMFFSKISADYAAIIIAACKYHNFIGYKKNIYKHKFAEVILCYDYADQYYRDIIYNILKFIIYKANCHRDALITMVTELRELCKFADDALCRYSIALAECNIKKHKELHRKYMKHTHKKEELNEQID